MTGFFIKINGAKVNWKTFLCFMVSWKGKE